VVFLNPEYIKKHPDAVPGLRVEVGDALKEFLGNLAQCIAGKPTSGFVRITRWRKLWKTKDAKLRKQMLDWVDVLVFVDGVPVTKVPLKDISTSKWCPFVAGLILQLPATMAIGLAVKPPSTLDPRPLVKIEVHGEPIKKEK
jgi:hypothetical protein